jgi:TonB family protein
MNTDSGHDRRVEIISRYMRINSAAEFNNARRIIMMSRALLTWSSAVALGAASLVAYGTAGAVTPSAQQPRDLRPNQPRPATNAEKQLVTVVASRPQDSRAAQELARLQEARGAIVEAEATLRASAQAAPDEAGRSQALAAFYIRTGRFERAVATLEAAAERDRSNASTHHLVATFYHAKLSDPALSREDRAAYIQRGLAAEDRALLADPQLLDAIVYKSLLLRAAAEIEPNPEQRARIVQLADDLRLQAATAWRTATPAGLEHAGAHPAPPPPPPPPVSGADDIEWTYAETSFVTVDGSSAPKKVKDVRPIYPPMALQMGVQGRVVVEAAIDAHGRVVTARVIESIPLLNQSTIDAVKQWRFDPATVAGAATPTVIHAEARFLPRKEEQ